MSTNLYRITTVIILLLLAGVQTPSARGQRDSIIVSLLTCWPGEEVYELCGHEAVRVRSTDPASTLDSVWNYGTFDFAQPNFVYRFVKGETDYMVSSYPMRWFLPEYSEHRRRVVEQDLNLTQAEARRMLEMLRRNALPANRTYRYNYVRDNCATRIVSMVDSASAARVVYPDSVKYGTFRNAMREYHRDYPWYQFGIDLALGSGIDRQLRGRDEMFVPLEMMQKVAGAHFADGRPLVSRTRVLVEGVPDATLGPTPRYATPLVACWAAFLLILLACWWMWRRHRILKWLYCLWFLLLGAAGCVITFLVFVSTHEATAPNLLLIWLNPLQIVIAAGIWFRAMRAPVTAMAYVDIIVLAVLLIVWPMQTQSANPAFFPLMGATFLLALTYAIIRTNTSYYRINEKAGKHGADGSGHARRSGTDRRRPSTSRGRNRR